VPLERIKSAAKFGATQKGERIMEALTPTIPCFDRDKPKTPIINQE
jgi:hypothetical protein